MIKRFDSVKRMAATLVTATAVGMVIEASGLSIWAQRLEVGYVREIVSPVMQIWEQAVTVVGLDTPRRRILDAKAALTPVMMAEPLSALAADEMPVTTAATEHAASSALADEKTAAYTEKNNQRSGEIPDRHAVLSVAASLRDTENVQIALVGDSMMAVGLAPVLRRTLSKADGVHIIRAYRSGTGLGRPDVFNWMEEYPRMRGIQKPQFIICAIGANDAQGFQIDRTVYAFGTSQWNMIYAQRVRKFLNLLAEDNVRILWLGMPVMREPGFSKKMMAVSALTKSVVTEHPQVTWLDPNPYLNESGSGFAQFRQNQKGQMSRIRGDDGIHLSDEGAAYLVPAIQTWLQSQQKLITNTPH